MKRSLPLGSPWIERMYPTERPCAMLCTQGSQRGVKCADKLLNGKKSVGFAELGRCSQSVAAAVVGSWLLILEVLHWLLMVLFISLRWTLKGEQFVQRACAIAGFKALKPHCSKTCSPCVTGALVLRAKAMRWLLPERTAYFVQLTD